MTKKRIVNAFRITLQEPGNLMQQCIVARGIALAWKILMEELHPSHRERKALYRIDAPLHTVFLPIHFDFKIYRQKHGCIKLFFSFRAHPKH